MLGTADHGAFCATLLLFVSPATHRGTAAMDARLCAFAGGVSARGKALRRLTRGLEGLAGIFRVGFCIRLGTP